LIHEKFFLVKHHLEPASLPTVLSVPDKTLRLTANAANSIAVLAIWKCVPQLTDDPEEKCQYFYHL